MVRHTDVAKSYRRISHRQVAEGHSRWLPGSARRAADRNVTGPGPDGDIVSGNPGNNAIKIVTPSMRVTCRLAGSTVLPAVIRASRQGTRRCLVISPHHIPATVGTTQPVVISASDRHSREASRAVPHNGSFSLKGSRTNEWAPVQRRARSAMLRFPSTDQQSGNFDESSAV